MRVFDDINQLPRLDHAVITSGFFDGVHLGHQKVLNRVKSLAQELGGDTALVTFWPHPRLVLQQHDSASLRLLDTPEERRVKLAKQGVQNLIEIPFTPSFATISATEFVNEILIAKMGVQWLVVGHDYRFGKGREGDFTQLKTLSKNQFTVEQIPGLEVNNTLVSSSKIRQLLLDGGVEKANQMLGQPYSLSGQVIYGNQVGSKLGFPTANIAIDFDHKLIPKEGVYAATVEYDEKKYQGMMYIGKRPTLNGQNQSIEVHIFDFEHNLYGQKISISPVALIRNDIQFSNLEALKKQIQADRIASLQRLEQTDYTP